MKIEHLALWVEKLEEMRNFYETYFEAVASEKYQNPAKNFESYFLAFESGCRLELMRKPEIGNRRNEFSNQQKGLVHFAIATASRAHVDELTLRLERDGFSVVGQPRTTGDGYYESVVLDPEGNIVEITA